MKQPPPLALRMPMSRRQVLALLLASRARASLAAPPPAIEWPRDAGAHPGHRIEWWYLTGWANASGGQARYGFQVTFFRRRLEQNQAMRSPLAARQLLFADVAITDVQARRLWHAQRMARWSGAPPGANRLDRAAAALNGMAITLEDWTLHDEGAALRAQAHDTDFGLTLLCTPTQPPLLQGVQGISRKGPLEHQFSHYYSLPHLQAQGQLRIGSTTVTLEAGSAAWLDHEWSDELMPQGASGWDWIGINLDDGSALTAFRLRDAAGQPLWAGGSLRANGMLRTFAPHEVRFEPGRTWRSPASNAVYPVEWHILTPAGTFTVRAAVDAQEVDSRLSSGAIYWEGLCEVACCGQVRSGRGYLEMTGYAGALHI